jgi:hypothetical protein
MAGLQHDWKGDAIDNSGTTRSQISVPNQCAMAKSWFLAFASGFNAQGSAILNSNLPDRGLPGRVSWCEPLV